MIQFLLSMALVAGGIGLAAYGISWSLTRLAISVAQRRQIVAEVNHRSSHTTPTPRLGGVGLMGGFLFGLAVVALGVLAPGIVPLSIRPGPDVMTLPLLGVMAGALIGAFLLGLWDDIANPPAVAKLLGQLLLAFVPPLLGWRIQQLHVPGMDGYAELGFAASVVITAAWILAMMNAVNFMDGINGIAGRFAQIAVVALFAAVFQFRGGEVIIVLCASIFGACSGFLSWNLGKAKTFMGDCGSQPLGLMIALLGVHVSNLPTSFPLPFVGFVLLVSPFLFDVGLTLVKRVLEGKNVLHAHREHLYQRHLAAHGENHDTTLFFFEAHMCATAALGAVYINMLYAPSSALWQSLVIGACGIVLTHYAWSVMAAEDRRVFGTA